MSLQREHGVAESGIVARAHPAARTEFARPVFEFRGHAREIGTNFRARRILFCARVRCATSSEKFSASRRTAPAGVCARTFRPLVRKTRARIRTASADASCFGTTPLCVITNRTSASPPSRCWRRLDFMSRCRNNGNAADAPRSASAILMRRKNLDNTTSRCWPMTTRPSSFLNRPAIQCSSRITAN